MFFFFRVYFHVLVAFWKNVYSNLLPIKKYVVLILNFLSCLYILAVNLLSDISFAIIFSHSLNCLFLLSIISFIVQNLLSLIRSHLFSFVFVFITSGGGSKKMCCNLCQKVFCLCFPLNTFIVSSLTFRSSIHFEFIFVFGVSG